MGNRSGNSELDLYRTCCFTGLRPQKLPFGFDEGNRLCLQIKERLKQEIIRLITEQHVTHFISGMALGVDQWAAEIILCLQEKYPDITLECALPCETQAAKWSVNQRERYFSIVERCSKETMLQTGYTRDCMIKRNRYMVDRSRYVLAVWDGSNGGTGYTVRYARSQNRIVQIINPTEL